MNEPTQKPTYHFKLPFLLPLHNQLRREYKSFHAYRQLLKKLAEQIAYVERVAPPLHPWERVKIEIVRHTTGKAPDIDNLYASAKPLLDVLQPNNSRHPFGLGLIADDAPNNCDLVCRTERAIITGKHTEITIEKL